MEFDDQDLQLLNNVCENGNYLEDADDDIRNQGKSLKPSVWYLQSKLLLVEFHYKRVFLPKN